MTLSQPETPQGPVENPPKISHAVLLTSAQLARGFFRLLFVLVVARELGPKQFGEYSLLIALLEMLAVASGTGYADYLTREAAKDARLAWGVASQLTKLRLSCVVPLSAVGLGILWTLGYSRTMLVAGAWLSLSLAPRSLTEATQGVLRGVGRYWAYLVVELGFDLALVVGLIVLLARRGGLNLVIATEVLAAVTAAVLSEAFVLTFRTSERVYLGRKELLKKSLIFNLYTFVGNMYDRIDILLLSKLAGDYATGVYSAAYRPLGTVQLIPYGVLYSILPALSRGEYAARQRLEKAMGFLLSVAFLGVLATMVYAGPAVSLLLGPRYAESAVALKILMWAVIFRYANFALNVRLLAGRHEKVFVTTSLVCLGVNLAGNLLLIPKYSWKAAAAITILTELVLLAQNVYWLRRTVGAIPKPYGWMQISTVFIALVCVTVAGEKLGAPLLVGNICLLLFLAFLFRGGNAREFTAVWGDHGNVESSNP